ncbi:hypothetical protein JB92DRAFT_997000 [Gautieria morchelliformis]|nr:hypothetical protein JB92DRAFT_997000 [Gautieria morchelliformis]
MIIQTVADVFVTLSLVFARYFQAASLQSNALISSSSATWRPTALTPPVTVWFHFFWPEEAAFYVRPASLGSPPFQSC